MNDFLYWLQISILAALAIPVAMLIVKRVRGLAAQRAEAGK